MNSFECNIISGKEQILGFVEQLAALDMKIAGQLGALYAGEVWNEKNFKVELEGKWFLSQLAIGPDNALLGYLIASKKEACAHIHRFAIQRNYRRQGVARRLYLAAVTAAKKLGLVQMTLVVSADNADANRFYQGLGMRRLHGDALRVFSKQFIGATERNDVLMLTVGESMFAKHAYVQDLEDA